MIDTRPLADCATWYSGGTPKTTVESYWGGPIPWITSGSLTEFHLRTSERTLTEKGLQNGSRLLPVNAILFVVRGMSLNSEFRIGIAKRPLAFGQDCKGLVAHEDLIPLYLAYAIRAQSREVLGMVDQAAHGTGRLPTDLIGSLPIGVPEREEQMRIAAALGAFDDLIEINRRQIEILEEVARLLYREWFVNFRFPGHENTEMMDSELGPLPEGWRVIRFNELVDEIMLSVDESEIPAGSPVVGLEHLPRRSTTLQAWDLAEEVGSRRKVFEMGDILFGKIRPYFHKVVDAPVAGFSSTDAIIFRPRQFAERALCIASSDDFVAFAVAGSNGTKMPRANTELLLGFAVPEPPTAIAREFESLLEPMSSLRNTLAAQIRVLEDARDLLLPRLVSGELDVSELDLDAVVGSVV